MLIVAGPDPNADRRLDATAKTTITRFTLTSGDSARATAGG
jgi:hypothetical protein